jgi:hypothetical protein
MEGLDSTMFAVAIPDMARSLRDGRTRPIGWPGGWFAKSAWPPTLIGLV